MNTYPMWTRPKDQTITQDEIPDDLILIDDDEISDEVIDVLLANKVK